MTTRKQQIEAVAGLIAENLILSEFVADPRREAEQLNATGWEFETSHGLRHNTWIRHTGVILNRAELEQAYRLAETMAETMAHT